MLTTPPPPFRRRAALATALALTVALAIGSPTAARAQRTPGPLRDPHIGYLYPAGGQRGTTVEIAVGGQFLDGVDGAYVSGGTFDVKLLKHDKPLSPKRMNEIRELADKAREDLQAKRAAGERPFFARGTGPLGAMDEYLKQHGVTAAELAFMQEFRRQRNDPKAQRNPQLAETATLAVTIPDDAAPGRRELRLRTPRGLSNPLAFDIGFVPEHAEREPNDQTAEPGPAALPLTINGQILPGDSDRFAFAARRGTRLVVAVAARDLIPHLADAVPGWFQATIALVDATGAEVAYADDFRFNPDPVLYYEIPADGTYTVEIKDALYRGREDFVYRLTVGELPFVTAVFPLGAPAGSDVTAQLAGWNLPATSTELSIPGPGPAVHRLAMLAGVAVANHVPFAADTLPEGFEQEPNNNPGQAQPAKLPIIINGRLEQPGDRDVFAFSGHAGQPIVAEVFARRLNSPLDAVIKITAADGRQLGLNDDCEDKSSGLITHHADSRLEVTLPATGTYYVHLGDTQAAGNPAHAYRLRIAPPQPDFELRVVPASINAPAGAAAPLTVYALRKDGFKGEIALALKDAPPGFALSGARIPAGQDRVRLTLTMPPEGTAGPVPLQLEGIAKSVGRELRRAARPAEDLTQAFIYHHLVTADALLASASDRGRPRPALRLVGQEPVGLQPGKTAKVRFSTGGMPAMFFADLGFELNDPPPGVTLGKISRDRDTVAIELNAAPDQAPADLEGNLLIDAFIERAPTDKDGKPMGDKRKMTVGTLPAIPFRIGGR